MVWETSPWEAMTNPFRNSFSPNTATPSTLTSPRSRNHSRDVENLESENGYLSDTSQSLRSFLPGPDSMGPILATLSSSPDQMTVGRAEIPDYPHSKIPDKVSISSGGLPHRAKEKRHVGEGRSPGEGRAKGEERSKGERRSARPLSSQPRHSLNSNTRPPNSKPMNESKKPTLKPVYGPDQSAPSKNVLIAVFGMTGTGKTSLIKSLAGVRADKLQTGHGLESCTQFIEKVECTIGGSQVTLVDTPGFDDSHRSDTEILSLIAAWLQTEYTQETFLSGLIYLHRISDVRMSGSSIKNLRMFRKLCGADNMSRVKLVTTMWDKVTPEEGSIRENDLLGPKGFWTPMKASGCLVDRHDGTPDSARALILGMLDNVPMMIKLQAEIASGKALIDTDAGASINEEILRLRKEHEEELEAVKEEMNIAIEQGNAKLQATLQEEHARVVARIEKNAEDQHRLQELRAGKLERDLQAATTARQMLEQSLNGKISSLERTVQEASPKATCRRCRRSFGVHGFGTTECPFCGKRHSVKLKAASWI